MKHLVIGLGEVGTAIRKLFTCSGIDKNQSTFSLSADVIHICIPYSENFIETIRDYQRKYKPHFTIIHSTVPVGTSRKLNALHSPMRGIHPNLYESLFAFPKFIGGLNTSHVADEFRRTGIKVIICDKQETTELGKLLDTEYYRVCIEFTRKSKSLCDKFNVPFAEAYTLFNMTYNEGYSYLNHKEFMRPVLQPIMQKIGGHCVLSNAVLLKNNLRGKKI